jgi:hypothetical protein
LSLPEHYKPFCRTHLRFALIMIAVALLAGISFQESGRKVLVSQAVPAGAHLEFILALALVHGHVFLVGVLLPLAFTWMLRLSLDLGTAALPERTLAWTSGLYIPGAVLTIILMLLKGYHLVLGVRHGALDFAALNGRFLFSSHVLRVGAYGLAHGLMGLGLAILVFALWRSLPAR